MLPSMIEKSAAMSPPQPPPLPEMPLASSPPLSHPAAAAVSSSSSSPSPASSSVDASDTAAPGGEEDGQPSLKPDAPEEAVQQEDQDPSTQAADRVSQSSEGPLAISEIAPPVTALAPRAKTHHLPATESTNMIFSDLYKGRKMSLSKLRPHKTSHEPHRTTAPPPEWLEKEYADLTCKDKTKQKAAIKRYMEATVKNDWEFQWPAHGSGQAHSDSKKKPERGRKRACPRRYSSDEAAPHAKAASGDNDIAIDSGADLGGSSRLDNGDPQEHDANDANNNVDLHLDDDNNDGSSSSSSSSYCDEEDDDDDDDDDDAESVYSVVSEDNVNFRPRLEWASELSDEGEDAPDAIPTVSPSAIGSLEASQDAALRSKLSKQARRRRANREEMTWNEGLACFEARRDAWTGARTVRVRTKPTPPPSVSPRSARRFFFTRSNSGSTAASTSPSNTSASEPASACQEGSVTTFDAQSIAKSDSSNHGLKNFGQTSTLSPLDQIPEELLPVETLLPLPYPILPPTNVLRASIVPQVYMGLYDKLIINSLQPACPINLSDMLKACVVGWKRDGEWPPQTKAAEPVSAAPKKQQQHVRRISLGGVETMNTVRRMSFGILGRGDADESRAGKGIRRSLQKAFGFATSAAGPET